MRRKTGREMRKLILSISIMMIVLVLAIIAYFLVDVIVTTDDNIEHNKEMMIDQSVLTLKEMAENIAGMGTNVGMFQYFDKELTQKMIAGDLDILYTIMVDLSLAFYPVEYVGIIREGEVVACDIRGGEEIDPEEMPVEPPQGDYQTLDRLGEEEGLFISVFYPMDLSVLGLEAMEVNYIVDRTAELAEIENYFNDQKNNVLVRLYIAAVIAILLSVLITTIGLHFFTSKYVIKPVERLNSMAEEIANGTFEGEVEVDEGSAFSALQKLLQSGQKVLQQMYKEMS